jgi:hypothetical protein
MSKIQSGLLFIAVAMTAAGNAEADRRVNLDLATELRHGCRKPNTPPPLTVDTAKSPRPQADADKPTRPLTEVIETGHECWRKPTPGENQPWAHPRGLDEHRSQLKPLLASMVTSSGR